MEVFADQQHGLDLTLAQQEALEGVQGPLAALGWIEGLPRAVVHWHIQEREHGRQERCERWIQCTQFACNFLTHPPRIIAGLEVKVGFQELTDGVIGDRLAIGGRLTFEQEPLLGPRGAEELVKEAGLPYPGFPHDGHELLVVRTGPLEGVAESLELRLPLYEACERPRCKSLEARPS